MAGPARARATIDVAAIAANVERMRRALSPGVLLSPVVKSDAYGHGLPGVLTGVLRGGADRLAVATAAEAAAVRALVPELSVLVLGALTPDDVRVALDAGAELSVWDAGLFDVLPDSARVHVKLDSGMGRLGTRDGAEATRLARSAQQRGMLAGLWTHFATADEPGDAFFAEQLACFSEWVTPLRETGAIVHAANSAAILREPASHFDMVRPGVAIYGMDPFGRDPAEQELLPALRLTSWVAAVKPVAPGESAGYGRRFVAERDTVLATIPIGYGDGWRRALTNDCDVVIRGERFALVGTVSMDNVTVDLGPGGGGVEVGDEVVLLGDGITAEEVARRIGTINYEVTCGLSQRVERVAM